MAFLPRFLGATGRSSRPICTRLNEMATADRIALSVSSRYGFRPRRLTDTVQVGMASLADHLPPAGSDPEAVLDAFGEWALDGGRPLYPHQDEAAFALAA